MARPVVQQLGRWVNMAHLLQRPALIFSGDLYSLVRCV